jgi:hypothetical protein
MDAVTSMIRLNIAHTRAIGPLITIKVVRLWRNSQEPWVTK